MPAAAPATHLKLVSQPQAPSAPPVVGTKAWSDAVRADARALVAEVDRGYIRVAELLYRMQSLRVDGSSDKGQHLYVAWGFGTFEAWVEADLCFQKHKALALIRIYRRIVVELADMQPATRDAILALGWTKVKELVRVLTLSNADHWAKVGGTVSYPDFRAAVAAYAEGLLKKQIDEAVELQKAAEVKKVDASAILPDDGTPPAPVHIEGAGFEGESDESDGTEGVPLPLPVKTIPMSFAFYPEQAKTMAEALALAEKNNPGKPKSYHLETIALEYLAGHHVGGDSDERRAHAFARLAECLGVDLRVVDRKTGKVLLNQDHTPKGG